MNLGLVLNSQEQNGKNQKELFNFLVEQAESAHEAGFTSIVAPQHYISDQIQLQPLPLLGRITSIAPNIQYGTGIIVLPLHHPVLVAENIATLDAMTNKRTIAGIGAGYRDIEFDTFDIPKSERGGRIREGIEILNRLWTEDGVTYNGEYYSVSNVTINPQPAQKPEIWCGANSKKAIERAAEIADCWYVNPHSTLRELRSHKRIYDEIRNDNNSNIAVPIRREIFVAHSESVATETVQSFLMNKFERLIDWGLGDAIDDSSKFKQQFEQLAKDRFIIGTPEDVCEELERYENQLNVDRVIARVHWPGMEHEKTIQTINLIGDEVIPNI